MLIRNLIVTLLVASGANGFVVPSSPALQKQQQQRVPTQLFEAEETGWDSFQEIKRTKINVPSGEEQRKFRRTVYTHDDWKKHRSQDRFFFYLGAMFNSGVYKNLGREVGAVTAVATMLVLYNAAVGGYQDLEGVKHAALISSQFLPTLSLPLAAFTLTSPSLGLLLGMFSFPLLICSSYKFH